MANQLKMADVQTILSLDAQGWSHRSIAKRLGVHRETVSRHVRQAAGVPKPAAVYAKDPGHTGNGSAVGAEEASKPAILHVAPGSAGLAPGAAIADLCGEGSKPANMHAGILPVVEPSASRQMPSARRKSHCDPWQDLIAAKVAADLSAQRIYQDLVEEQDFPWSYSTVQRYVKGFKQPRPLPFRRLECAPGEEAQVDFGTAAPILTAAGKRLRPHVLRVVLSYSRKGYSEVVLRQSTESFIRCLENAFRHFGGVPQTLVIDNLRAAVSRADHRFAAVPGTSRN